MLVAFDGIARELFGVAEIYVLSRGVRSFSASQASCETCSLSFACLGYGMVLARSLYFGRRGKTSTIAGSFCSSVVS